MNYDKELEFAKELANEAGKIMRRYFKAEDIGTEWKEDNTPLTIADTKINDLVIERVKKTFPTHGVIGEEASFEADGNFGWVVDPIDGTIPFSLGIPLSTFSLALVDRKDGQPVVAVVYDPYLDHLYAATKGQRAYLNNVPIQVSQAENLERSYVSVLGGFAGGEERYFKKGVCTDILSRQGAKNFSFLSQVYSAIRVASGELVGSVFGYGSPWDSAAVVLLVETAGGVVSDLHGNKRRYDEFGVGCILSANKKIHSQLLQAVKEASS